MAAAGERIAQGVLPWRTDPTQRAAFLRPVASLLMWLDYTLFGLASLPAHLHSLLWFVAFALSVRALYARLLPRRAATIALLACLMSSASLQTIKWWSARNALLAALFAVWCLYFYLDWWSSGHRGRLAAALAFLALAVLSAESALALLAFPLAHAAVMGRNRPGRAARRLAPLLAAGVGYMALRWWLDYGVSSNALYLNPFAEPLAYVTTALPRLHRVLAIVYLNHASEILWIVLPLLGALAALIVGRLRAVDDETPLVAWLTAGSLLSLAVCFASRSSLRPWTMLIPQLGAHALLGLLVTYHWSSGSQAVGWWRWRRALVGALAVVCLVAPLYRHWTAATDSRAKRRTHSSRARAEQFPPNLRQALTASARRAVFLTSPYQLRTADYLRLWHAVDVDSGLAVLTVTDNPFSGQDYRLTRTGETTFSLSSEAPLVRRNDFYRFDDRQPLRTGDVVTGDGFRVTVEAMRGDAVAALSVELDANLSEADIVLMDWVDGRFELVEAPPVGREIVRP